MAPKTSAEVVKEGTPQNTTMFQGFEWNVPADGKHYKRLLKAIAGLKEIGIDNIWLPPGCKASSPEGNGYDVYDLYDLGEFEQKGSTATKWGSKEELMTLSKKAQEVGVGLYWDAVLNHKASADHKEKCKAVECDENDRNKEVSDVYEINAWLGFDFPGRGDKYSSQKYHWYHFSGTDFNADNNRNAIYKIKDETKGWSESVADENGNADYLMFADLDYSHPEVCEDVKNWGVWITKEVPLAGFRLDAVQHFSQRFTNELVDHVNEECGNKFWVGELWQGDVSKLTEWLETMDHKFSLYDSPLLNNFSQISKSQDADLRKVFDKTLVKEKPVNAVTVVMNHDTQPGQTVATPVETFFKPLAYALTLLRRDGYPCPFYGDLYGISKGPDSEAEPPACSGKLADLILTRKLYAYGEQQDYFNEKNCVGWVRPGTWDRTAGCAVVLSNAAPGRIRMAVGIEHKEEVWTDVLGWSDKKVEIDPDGFGEFDCGECSVSVYVWEKAEGRDGFGKFDDKIYED